MEQISEYLFTTEEQAVIARSKAEGSYMKAPNGQATNLNEKQWAQVRTRAFRDWFGDWENCPDEASKVRDANGEPLVVYHGSRENFYEFKRWTDGLINSGHFFSPDRKNALGYGGNIYDVYLNLRNPLEVDAQGANFSSIEYGGEKVAASDLGNLAEMEGYDGVVISDVADSADMGSENDRTVDYISFAANQIKSASQNTGSFLESQDDIRFREISQDDGGKSLVGLHNISEEKLLKALKLGGLANPSAAVIDIARQSHEEYGEISLVLPSSMIDKRTGRNAGTFSGDAWTPVYPQIERQFSGDGSGRVRDAISRLPQEMQPDVRSAWNNYMDGRDEGSAFAYQFLYERGEAPEFRKVEPLFGEHLRNRISAIDALDNYDDFMPYGSSSFIVTDQGVTEFTVSYPVDIVNESKNVELLSMDTIKEIIKDDMTKNSDQYDFTQNHTYNNLKLGYIRLKDASDKDKCTYVPAWCLSKQDKGYDRYPVYVNAIDGTIIRSDDLI